MDELWVCVAELVSVLVVFVAVVVIVLVLVVDVVVLVAHPGNTSGQGDKEPCAKDTFATPSRFLDLM
jgi:hypothetical protein